jgi:hypothetical protein
MSADGHRQLLERLNTFDTGVTEEERRTERQAAIERTIETEKALKWGRLQSEGVWGVFGRLAYPY